MPPVDPPSGPTTANLAPGLARTAAQYDEVPYESNPFPQTHPARLAAIATLSGLTPPPVATARILEIGCAAGGNIIPLAAQFPRSWCLGVDLSGAQIAQGRRRAEGLGLSNIELRPQSVTEIGAGDGTFDYVICHGVYSWVPPDVRAAILRVCAERLNAHGLAIISYNVLPGWHIKRAVRDALVAHVADIADPSQRIAQARWFVGFLRDNVPPGTPYAATFRTEAAMLAGERDDYLLYEFLSDENSAFTVAEFARTAAGHGLGYLAETELHTMSPEGYGEDIAAALRQLPADRPLQREQYIDILTGRTFRQSILVKAAAAHIARPPDAGRLTQLHVACRRPAPLEDDAPKPETAAAPEGQAAPAPEGQAATAPAEEEAASDGTRRAFTTHSLAAAMAMRMLMDRFPRTALTADLVADTQEFTEVMPGQATVIDELHRMMISGALDIFSEPVRIGVAADERPRVTDLARHDAAQGALSTVNLRHERVALSDAGRLVMPLLDGTRDRAALCDTLLGPLADRAAPLLPGGHAATGDADRQRAALDFIDRMLGALEATSLLQPAPT